MPQNCPNFNQRYNACLDCRNRHQNECWANFPIVEKLVDILTTEERLAILEDRKETPPVNIVTITHDDYQQLQRLILMLKEKLESHIDKTKPKKYKDYEVNA